MNDEETQQKIDDAGPAFPGQYNADRYQWCGLGHTPVDETDESASIAWPGMTLRDWFAGQALAAFLSSETAQEQLQEAVVTMCGPDDDRREVINKILAKRSYWLADAMLAARVSKEPGA